MKLIRFLVTFNFPIATSAIRIDLYNVMVNPAYLMKIIIVTYLMKIIIVTYLMKIIIVTYLMKIIPETGRAH